MSTIRLEQRLLIAILGLVLCSHVHAQTRRKRLRPAPVELIAFLQAGDNGEKKTAVFDSSLIEKGRDAFTASCTDCHNAERSLNKTKTFDEWMVTIKKMAALEDADIGEEDFQSIASYLTTEASAKTEGSDDSTMGDEEREGATKKDDSSGTKLDSALVERGRTAFNASCTQCHNAERSLSKRKSLSGWMSTIRRMAAMDGAQVARSDFQAIATYLVSLNSGNSDSASGDLSEGSGDVASEWNFSATTSTVWRGASEPMENSGFFVDAWVSAHWQSSGPVSAKITTCTSCHSDRNPSSGFTFELVEASATLDLRSLLIGRHSDDKMSGKDEGEDDHLISGEIKAGRFVVPFGAFAAMSHPGSYRTVSNPLMFDMGRRIAVDRTFQPVLMAPFSDEGVDLGITVTPRGDWSARFDFFAVNGLQGNTGGINFNASRSYTDNNRRPDYGGRFSVGNQRLRLGISAMTGTMTDDGTDPIDYELYGWDATLRVKDKLRFYFEHALRNDLAEEALQVDELTWGYIAEMEVQLCESLSLLTRFDTLEHELEIGADKTKRFTWGPNVSLPGGSLLILNHEHWIRSDSSDVDVIALRWTASF